MVEDIQTQTDQSVNAGETVESQTQEQSIKTFTQEEVTGFVAKEAKKAQEKIFKDLGFEDFNSARKDSSSSKSGKTHKRARSRNSQRRLLSKRKS